jgi:hypothetical protein
LPAGSAEAKAADEAVREQQLAGPKPPPSPGVPKSTATDIAAVLAQLGGDAHAEIDVWAKGVDGLEYVDVIGAQGFGIPAFAKQFGGGDYKLDVYTIDTNGRRTKRGSSRLKVRTPLSTPAPAAANGSDAMTTAAAGMVTMMSTAMAGMASAFQAIRPPDPLPLRDLIALLRPQERSETSADKVLSLVEKGMQIGERIAEGGGDNGSGSLVGAAKEIINSPLAGAIAKRLEQETAAGPATGPVRVLPAPANGQAPAEQPADLDQPVTDLSQIGSRIQLLAPMVVLKLRLGKTPAVVASELADEVYDLIGAKSPEVWDQLCDFAENQAENFVSVTVGELQPRVPASMHGQLELVVRAVREELIKPDDDEETPAA